MVELTAEALTLAEHNQIDREQYREFVAPFFANVIEEYAPRMMAGTFEPAGFSSVLGLKDARLAFELADESRTPAPLAGVVHDHLVEGMARCRGECKSRTAISNVLRKAKLDGSALHQAVNR